MGTYGAVNSVRNSVMTPAASNMGQDLNLSMNKAEAFKSKMAMVSKRNSNVNNSQFIGSSQRFSALPSNNDNSVTSAQNP